MPKKAARKQAAPSPLRLSTRPFRQVKPKQLLSETTKLERVRPTSASSIRAELSLSVCLSRGATYSRRAGLHLHPPSSPCLPPRSSHSYPCRIDGLAIAQEALPVSQLPLHVLQRGPVQPIGPPYQHLSKSKGCVSIEAAAAAAVELREILPATNDGQNWNVQTTNTETSGHTEALPTISAKRQYGAVENLRDVRTPTPEDGRSEASSVKRRMHRNTLRRQRFNNTNHRHHPPPTISTVGTAHHHNHRHCQQLSTSSSSPLPTIVTESSRNESNPAATATANPSQKKSTNQPPPQTHLDQSTPGRHGPHKSERRGFNPVRLLFFFAAAVGAEHARGRNGTGAAMRQVRVGLVNLRIQRLLTSLSGSLSRLSRAHAERVLLVGVARAGHGRIERTKCSIVGNARSATAPERDQAARTRSQKKHDPPDTPTFTFGTHATCWMCGSVRARDWYVSQADCLTRETRE